MNTCDKYAALLDSYLDGECTPEESEQVRNHLETCPACAAYVRDILRIREVFPTLTDTSVPDGFADRVLAALPDSADAVADSNAPSQRKRIWFRTLTSLAACFLLILLVRTVLPSSTSAGGADNAAMTSAAAQETGAGASCEEESAGSEDAADDIMEYAAAAKSYDEDKVSPRDTDPSVQRKNDAESPIDSASNADTGESILLPLNEIGRENDPDSDTPVLGTSTGSTSSPVPEPSAVPAAPELSTPASGAGASGSLAPADTSEPFEDAAAPSGGPETSEVPVEPETAMGVSGGSDGSEGAEKGFVRLSLMASEAEDLLADYTPVSVDGTESIYHLTRVQYDQLLASLERIPPSEPLDSSGTYAEIVVTH